MLLADHCFYISSICKDFWSIIPTDEIGHYYYVVRLAQRDIAMLTSSEASFAILHWSGITLLVNLLPSLSSSCTSIFGVCLTDVRVWCSGRVDELSGDCIYHDVDTETGSSGSPVVKLDGSLIGLHRASYDKNRNKATNVRHILAKLLEGSAICDNSLEKSAEESDRGDVTFNDYR